jgi:SAM-dependent methyltransferase
VKVEEIGMSSEGFARVPDDWFVDFHRGLAARFWEAAGAAMLDADLAIVGGLLDRLLDGGRDARVLDVPCGNGRLALALARDGYEVIGIDIAEGEVERARAATREAGLPARFLVGDLRALPQVEPADVVLSWGNSFGYGTPADTARSLAGLRRALRPGGRLVLESLTVAESLLVGGLEPTAEHEFDGVRMSMRNVYRAAESRLESDLRFEDTSGLVERSRVAHRVHTAGEIARMLEQAGFRDVELLGADGLAPYELGSPRLVAVATV